MLRSVFLTAALSLSLPVFAGGKKTEPKSERLPASEGVATVQASGLKQAWGKFLRDPRVMAAMKGVRAGFKDCGGYLSRIDENQRIGYYSGRGGAGHHFSGVLLPVYGGCAGTGMIEYIGAMAKIGIFIDMDNEDSEKYVFYGFVKVQEIPIDAKDQSAGLGD